MTLHLALPAASVRCSSCPASAEDVPSGLPDGWDGVFIDRQWIFHCPDCRPLLLAPILAVLRPLAREVALFVGSGPDLRSCALSLAEARQLRDTLGQALALADRPGECPA